ncbi:MAG TPA: threonine/serine dehydratase, partial [Acidimicrobiales bacterium]|nr:threonine/serine dehydratase [Acidimicrobiales bacterium]
MRPATQETAAIPIGHDDILAAAARIAPWVHRTPVMTSRTIDARCGGTVFLKCENFQKVGAFKFRGAVNALLQLDEAGRRAGVVTHSSGNHAQALALAGKLLGVPVTVVMPRTAPAVKREATEGYGARIVPCEPTLADREATVAAEIERHGSALVHPFNDWNVIAGQGTAALELLDQAGPLDAILCPVGGGGLLSGTALAVKGQSTGTRVIGVEPARADDARR